MTLTDEGQTLLLGEQKFLSSKLFFRGRILVPFVFMLGQITLCVIAWGFAVIMMHKPILLPDYITSWIWDYYWNDISTIVTIISTILALIGSK